MRNKNRAASACRVRLKRVELQSWSSVHPEDNNNLLISALFYDKTLFLHYEQDSVWVTRLLEPVFIINCWNIKWTDKGRNRNIEFIWNYCALNIHHPVTFNWTSCRRHVAELWKQTHKPHIQKPAASLQSLAFMSLLWIYFQFLQELFRYWSQPQDPCSS